jgi:predicted AAA+ superfamily ATPase
MAWYFRNVWVSFFICTHYSNNMLKRMVTKPKLYFYDTGLVAYLTKWSNSETLMNGA